MRLALLFGSLLVALCLGVIALQTPAPRGLNTSPQAFSAARAMVDVREIARRPHPVGSADHARVRAYLIARMTALGLSPTLQSGPLSPEAIARLEGRPETAAAIDSGAINIVGVLPGRDRSAPAVMMMAHYDTVPGSPGAADDTTGVAAILEAVRAIRTRGPADRDLVVLFTDAEELNLDGARVFFGDHPLRDRIGAVVNLEARGGGGRAMMFETGPGNAETVALFARAARQADGGTTSNALAVLVYSLMPNGTDFTVPRARGIAGVNLAFIGRPDQYHARVSTPEALDQGSVQHIGSQALEATDALLRAPTLPVATKDAVYADVLGRFIVAYSPATGWLILGLTGGLFGLAVWGARRATGLSAAEVGRGMLSGVWALSTGVVLTQAVRLLAGPLAERAESADAYYVLLARLPWIEAGTVLTVLAVGLALLAGRAATGRQAVAGLTLFAAATILGLGGLSLVGLVLLVMAAISVVLALWHRAWPTGVIGGWLGLIALIGALALIVQVVAPTAAFLFVWPTLLAAFAAATAAMIAGRLPRSGSQDLPARALIPAAAVAALGGGWLVYLAHPVFLGIGMDLPGVLMLLGLLILMMVRPLGPPPRSIHAVRGLAVAAAACLVLACGVSLAARFAEPMPVVAAQPA